MLQVKMIVSASPGLVQRAVNVHLLMTSGPAKNLAPSVKAVLLTEK